MRYLYGEWDPSTDSEQATSSGTHLNAVGLAMSTYVAATVVGTTYDEASRDGNGYGYLCRNDCRNDVSFDDDTTMGVCDISMLQNGEFSEYVRTADNEKCIENVSVENSDVCSLTDHLRNTIGVSVQIADSSNAEIATTDALEMKHCSTDDCRSIGDCRLSDDSDVGIPENSREEISDRCCMDSKSEENGIPP